MPRTRSRRSPWIDVRALCQSASARRARTRTRFKPKGRVRLVSHFAARYPAAKARALAVGDHAKIGNGEERFWVRVASVGATLRGAVANVLASPALRRKYPVGKIVAFERRHIYDVMPAAREA